MVPNTAWWWRTHLLLVGKDSVVTTSREFHAEMLRPLYRHSMNIIMDSLVPNHRKKQLMPDRTMEPPGHKTNTNTNTDTYAAVEREGDKLMNGELYVRKKERESASVCDIPLNNGQEKGGWTLIKIALSYAMMNATLVA